VYVKAIRVLVEAVREPVKVPLYRGFETVAEAWESLQGPLSVNVGRVSVVEAMNMSVEAVRGLIKVVRVPIEVVSEPKEAVRVQHSHSLYNTLTTVRNFYYKPRENL
jgi:hypothetical protein